MFALRDGIMKLGRGAVGMRQRRFMMLGTMTFHDAVTLCAGIRWFSPLAFSGGVCTPRLSETPPHRPAVHTHWAYAFIYFGIGRRLRELEWTELSTINLRLQDAGCSRLQECNRHSLVLLFAKQQVTSNNVLELRVGSCTDGQLQTQTIDLQSW